MPKVVDFEQRKQEIIEKAMKVFIEKGYHKTNLADIAKECNMGRTTLYQYFKTRMRSSIMWPNSSQKIWKQIA